jgi:hypothetical protein
MTHALPAAIALSAGVCASAAAQTFSFTSDSTMTISMAWREATSTGGTIPNPDGVLEPGESALIQISNVSFSNQGGLAHFAPPIGTFSSGTVLGLSFGYLDLDGSGDTQGVFNNSIPLANSAGTSGFGVRAAWRLNGNGTVTGTGISALQFGQFPVETISTANPIPNMFRLLWTPADYSTRSVRFDLNPAVLAGSAFAGVYLDFDGSVGGGVCLTPSNVFLDHVTIDVAPSPPTLTLLLAAPIAIRRRRPSGAPLQAPSARTRVSP